MIDKIEIQHAPNVTRNLQACIDAYGAEVTVAILRALAYQIETRPERMHG